MCVVGVSGPSLSIHTTHSNMDSHIHTAYSKCTYVITTKLAEFRIMEYVERSVVCVWWVVGG